MAYGGARSPATDRPLRAGEFDVATISHNRFQSVIPVTEASAVIPATFEDRGGPALRLRALGGGDPRGLLPRGFPRRSSAALLENAASEQGARMSAMDNATRNAGDMIDR
jgi:F-type H+-transporting ATPase subunit gamma